MDYKKILQSRENRGTRLARPFENFFATFNQCNEAAEAILGGSFAPEFTPLMERSIIISTVTAIEVYYRDILDFAFRFCAPEFFEPKLKQMHPDKYDISDLIAIYRHRIHPLELVVNSQSFQNVDKIERVFSKIVGKGFWSSVIGLEARVKDQPETIVRCTGDNLKGLQRTFDLRHELVHNPARRSFLNESVAEDFRDCSVMVFGSDLILSKVLMDNRDPSLDSDEDA